MFGLERLVGRVLEDNWEGGGGSSAVCVCVCVCVCLHVVCVFACRVCVKLTSRNLYIESTHITDGVHPALHVLTRASHKIIRPIFCLDIKHIFVFLVIQVGVNSLAILQIHYPFEITIFSFVILHDFASSEAKETLSPGLSLCV